MPPADPLFVTISFILTPGPDLELYNIRTDAFGLIALAMLALVLGGAGSSNASSVISKPYAKAGVWATVFHHVTTGILAFQQYTGPGYTTAMTVGWVFSGGLALLGTYVALLDMSGASAGKAGLKKRA